MNKQQIRNLMNAKRMSLSESDIKRASDIICEKISKIESYLKAHTVLFYYPFRNEVDVTGLIEKSFMTKTVCLPVTYEKNKLMEAKKISGFDQLVKGEYGIMSPGMDCETVDPEEIDFVVIPLLAYDKMLYRVGYGGGYYDRYLPLCINAFKCGASYSFQSVPTAAHGSYDVPLDEVVTEV